jgi:dTDP-4-dehydrorhamnose 3,5-epimerase-like enzyme
VRVTPIRLDGPRLIEPAVHGDERGFCLESLRADVFAEAGIDDPAVVVTWPLPGDRLTHSARDQAAPTLAELAPSLPFHYPATR